MVCADNLLLNIKVTLVQIIRFPLTCLQSRALIKKKHIIEIQPIIADGKLGVSKSLLDKQLRVLHR